MRQATNAFANNVGKFLEHYSATFLCFTFKTFRNFFTLKIFNNNDNIRPWKLKEFVFMYCLLRNLVVYQIS